jgi:tubulin polyglutamylase TTLL6/13
MKMAKILPEDYDFFPSTFMLPNDNIEFQNYLSYSGVKTFIVKPANDC